MTTTTPLNDMIAALTAQASAEATAEVSTVLHALYGNEAAQEAYKAVMKDALLVKTVQTSIIDVCAKIATDMPEINRTTHEPYKYTGGSLSDYYYGKPLGTILGALLGMQRMSLTQQDVALATLGLTASMIQDLNAAVGHSAYYSTKTMTVVNETPMDVEATYAILQVVVMSLATKGIFIDLNRAWAKFEPARLQTMYLNARLKAEKTFEDNCNNEALNLTADMTVRA